MNFEDGRWKEERMLLGSYHHEFFWPDFPIYFINLYVSVLHLFGT